MPPVSLIDLAGLSPDRSRALALAVADQTTLERALAWARSLTPPRSVDEILTQDEFTHDVLVPVDSELWLAYDVT